MQFIKAGFAASIPFLFGFLGVLTAGVLSDFPAEAWLRRWRFQKNTRRLRSSSLDHDPRSQLAWKIKDLLNLFMTIAFFGTGLASIVWSLVSAIAPERLIGLTGGVFNFIGGLSGIIVPIGIGYLADGSNFAPALIFVSCLTLLGAFSTGVLIGKVERLEVKESL